MRILFVSILLGAILSGWQAVSALAGQGCLSDGCHHDLTGARYLHGPVAAELAGVKGCEVCHLPTGPKCTATKGGSFQTRVKDICLTCHGPGTGSQHTQAEVQSKCLNCHNPHGSETSPQLLRPGKG